MLVGVDIDFHGFTDVRLTLTDVSYIPGLGFKLYSVHAASRTNLVIFHCLGNIPAKCKWVMFEGNSPPSKDSRRETEIG